MAAGDRRAGRVGVTDDELIGAYMTTIANPQPVRLDPSQDLQLEAYWLQEHKALMDLNAEKSTRRAWDNVRACRGVVLMYERRIRR